MTSRQLEERVRDLTWPAPSDGLRTRILTAAATLRTAEPPAIPRVQALPISGPSVLRRRAWRTAAVFAIAATFAGIVGCAALDIWSQRELTTEIARLEAKYGSLDPSTSRPTPVPDWDNRALVVRSAATLVVPIPGQQYHFIRFPIPSPVPDELRTFADANRDAIGRLDEIRTRHRSSWDVDYRKNEWPWGSVRILSNAVYVMALVDIESGRADDAGRAIVSGLGISASLRQESDGVAQSIRLHNLLSMQFTAIRRLLSDAAPASEVLKDLSWWLAENRTPPPMPTVLLAEMKHTNEMFARMEKGDVDPGTVEYIYPMTWPDWPSALVRPAAVVGRPFVRMARVRSLRRTEHVLDALMGPRPRPLLPEPTQPQRWALVDRLVEKFTSQIWEYGDTDDDFASQLAAAEIAVALRRFKLERNVYPDDLSELIPSYLDHLPIDPYTGEPPIYTRLGSGFTLRASGSRTEVKNYLALEWEVKR